MKTVISAMALILLPGAAWASGGHAAAAATDFASSVYGYLGLVLFIVAYSLVPLENKLHLRKSKPVLLAAGLIWILVALAYNSIGDTHTAHQAIKESLLEYAELFLFLLAAMTYINALEERNVFQSLRAFLVSRGYSLRKIFWITGSLSFMISPIMPLPAPKSRTLISVKFCSLASNVRLRSSPTFFGDVHFSRS